MPKSRPILITILCTLLASCSTAILFLHSWGADSTTNVTNDPDYMGGFHPHTHYAAQQDLFVVSVNGTPTGLRLPINPTIPEYEATPQKWPWLTPLRKGTWLELTRITLDRSFEDSGLSVYATPTTPPFAGKELNINSTCTRLSMGDITLSPNPDYLKAAN